MKKNIKKFVRKIYKGKNVVGEKDFAIGKIKVLGRKELCIWSDKRVGDRIGVTLE